MVGVLPGQDSDAYIDAMSPPPIIWNGANIPASSTVLGLKHGIVSTGDGPLVVPTCMDLTQFWDLTRDAAQPWPWDPPDSWTEEGLGWQSFHDEFFFPPEDNVIFSSTPVREYRSYSGSGSIDDLGDSGFHEASQQDEIALYLPFTGCAYITIDFTMTITVDSYSADQPIYSGGGAQIFFTPNNMRLPEDPIGGDRVIVSSTTGSQSKRIHHEGYMSFGDANDYTIGWLVQGFTVFNSPGGFGSADDIHVSYSWSITDISFSLRYAE